MTPVVEITDETSLHGIKPSYRRGIRHVAEIWTAVQPQHITNHCKRAGIMLEAWTAAPGVEEGALEQDFQVLQPLIKQVHDVPREMEREVVNCDEEQSEGSMDGEAGSHLLHHH